jgi:type IV secretory pathway VirB4 component
MFRKKKEKENQEKVFNFSNVLYKDIIAPSCVKEIAPGDISASGQASSYWVEIGDISGATRYCRSFYANITGNSTYAGILNSLYTIDFGEADCDVALHISPADTSKIVWQLEREIARMEADYAEEANSARRQTLLKRIHEMQRRHSALTSNNEKLFFGSIEVTVTAPDLDEMRQFCNLLTRRLKAKNIILKAADMRQLDAFINATPLGDNMPRDAYQDLESSNITDMFPFGSGGLRHHSGVIMGRDPQGNIIFYNCWHPTHENYNIVIFGRAGSGKSYLVKLVTARSALINIMTVVIDPEREYENLTVGLGCPYISLSPDSQDTLNIFDVDLVDEDGVIRADIEDAIKAVQAVVFRMIRVYDESVLTGQVKVMILEKIKALYKNFEITENPQSLYENPADMDADVIHVSGVKKKMPQLSNLIALMRQEPALNNASRILATFTKEGGTSSSAVFDCQSTVEDIWKYPMVAFSVAGLDEEVMRPIGLFIATRWVWNKLSRDRRKKKRIVVDEAQTMMDTPETAKWLEDSFRRARKRNISMCACTQGFEVFLRVDEGMGILKNATTKMLLKQEAIDIQSVRKKFSLSDGESEFLLTAPKGWGIVKANEDASVFYGEATEHEHQMFTSDPNELAMMSKRRDKSKQSV